MERRRDGRMDIGGNRIERDMYRERGEEKERGRGSLAASMHHTRSYVSYQISPASCSVRRT